LYDRQYKELHATLQFRWGMDCQHLHHIALVEKSHIATGENGQREKMVNQIPERRANKLWTINPTKKFVLSTITNIVNGATSADIHMSV